MNTASLTAGSARAKARRTGPVTEFFVRLVREKRGGAIGALIFLIMLLTGIFADVIAPDGYNAINPIERLKPPSWELNMDAS